MANNIGIFELLALADEYNIKKIDEPYNGTIEIQSKQMELCCDIYPTGEAHFYVTGVYNSGCDFAEISLEGLDRMRRFVKLLNDNFDGQ